MRVTPKIKRFDDSNILADAKTKMIMRKVSIAFIIIIQLAIIFKMLL
jgi:hypothetical protein